MEELQNGDGPTKEISDQLKNLKVESSKLKENTNPDVTSNDGASTSQANGGPAEDEDTDDSDETSSEDEPIRAPLELLGEFLLYVREGKWEDAKKLCLMILIYEPKNPEALKFQKLIDEKIQIEKELAEMSDDESSTDEESSDEDEEDEDEDGENVNREDEEDEEDNDDDDDDKEDRTKHLKNKLVFSHHDDNDEKCVWKP